MVDNGLIMGNGGYVTGYPAVSNMAQWEIPFTK